MAFEDDVLAALRDGMVSHARFYVDQYSKADATSQAQYRSAAIEHDAHWTTRSPHDSAQLRFVEFLDSHPAQREHVTEFVAALHREESTPTMSRDDGKHLRDPGPIISEGLHRLEGGFIGAVAQGVANMIWDDPKEALEKAAPFVTLGELWLTHGEGRQAGHDSAEAAGARFGGENRHDAARELGKTDLDKALHEIGSKSSPEAFTQTAERLGWHEVSNLDVNLGTGRVDDLLQAQHPGQPLAGFGAYETGNVRHDPGPNDSPKDDLSAHDQLPFDPAHSSAVDGSNSTPDSHPGQSRAFDGPVVSPFDPAHSSASDPSGGSGFLYDPQMGAGAGGHGGQVASPFDPAHTSASDTTGATPHPHDGQGNGGGHAGGLEADVAPFDPAHTSASDTTSVAPHPHGGQNHVGSGHAGGSEAGVTPFDPAHTSTDSSSVMPHGPDGQHSGPGTLDPAHPGGAGASSMTEPNFNTFDGHAVHVDAPP